MRRLLILGALAIATLASTGPRERVLGRFLLPDKCTTNAFGDLTWQMSEHRVHVNATLSKTVGVITVPASEIQRAERVLRWFEKARGIYFKESPTAK